ncbi:unnamed protein product [Alopecurus aequalis]
MLPSVAAVLEDDDLLAKILLRLPPQPSSLPRASAVSKSWRSLVSNPAFSRRFRIHHRRNPPLLGCFIIHRHELRFQPTLDPPNRLPEDRFPFPIHGFTLLGCRHGFLLMLRTSQGTLELLVWDPVNGHEHPIAIPPGFGVKSLINGAVLRAAHGDINHFQVVLVSTNVERRAIACVYSSETGEWGNAISTPLPLNASNLSLGVIDPLKPAVLVGDSLYILLLGKSSGIIEFDVRRQSLAVIPLPLDSNSSRYYSVMRAEGGGLGLLFLSTSDGSAQLWKWKTDCDGGASWVLGRTIELDKLLLSPKLKNPGSLQIQGIAEENNVVLLWSYVGVFMVQLDSLQLKKLPGISFIRSYPFECVYAAGI